MLETQMQIPVDSAASPNGASRLVVIWIDWYAYHVARFEALLGNKYLAGATVGIEMIGGIGVHAGLKFREGVPATLPVQTLFPGASWRETKGRKLALALWKRLTFLNPSVVLVPGYYTLPGLAAALWGKIKRRRTVLMTESTEADHSRVWWKEAVKGLLIRSLFDWAVAGGAAHKRYLRRLGFSANRIASFYDVVDNRFFGDRAHALRKHSQAGDFDLPSRYFLYVGRLAEEKNLGGLLTAYSEYRRFGGTWALVLVGDGPERHRLEGLAAGCDFGADIHFAGLRTTSELPQFYAFAGCFVLPSTREPWGLVANEAMASCLPVIVSDRCGCAEDLVQDGGNGCSFNPELPGDLTSCLTAIGNLDSDALLQMGQRSAEIIAHFSPKAWAAEIARIVKA